MDFASILGALRNTLGERSLMSVHVAVMVAEHPDGIDQLDLAHWAGVPPNTLTKMLRELRDEGLIASATHGLDRRRRVVRPTDVLLEKWHAVCRAAANAPKRARDADAKNPRATADVD